MPAEKLGAERWGTKAPKRSKSPGLSAFVGRGTGTPTGTTHQCRPPSREHVCIRHVVGSARYLSIDLDRSWFNHCVHRDGLPNDQRPMHRPTSIALSVCQTINCSTTPPLAPSRRAPKRGSPPRLPAAARASAPAPRACAQRRRPRCSRSAHSGRRGRRLR